MNICEGRVGMLIWTRVVKDFVTNLIDQVPSWEASKSCSSQEIPYSWWNPRFITVFTWAYPLPLSWASQSYLHSPILFLLRFSCRSSWACFLYVFNHNSVSILTQCASCTTYSSFLIRLPCDTRLKSTNNFAHYGGFTSLLLLPFS